MDSNTQGPTYQKILDMAHEHGVSYEATPIDKIGEAISNLSDNELTHNDATRALIALRRAGILSAKEGHSWLGELMNEMEIK